jgi:NADPH-dependent ferric siderophore reductase
VTGDADRRRRPAPPFRRATVIGTTAVTPRLTRVDLEGDELVGLPVPEPAGSVRLLLPDAHDPELPTWAGNHFVYADGSRPALRTLTPVDTDPARGRLAVEVVRHGAGRATEWAARARPGDATAISGPARGYVPPAGAARFLLGGDETAIPALRQLVAAVPDGVPVEVLVEIADPAARLPLTDREDVTVHWVTGTDVPGAALADAFASRTVGDDTHVWAGGEAAAVQRIRRHVHDTLGIDRARATARGYWKHGRSASADA